MRRGGGQGRLHTEVALELNPESWGQGACEGLEVRVWAAPEAGLLKPQRPGGHKDGVVGAGPVQRLTAGGWAGLG